MTIKLVVITVLIGVMLFGCITTGKGEQIASAELPDNVSCNYSVGDSSLFGGTTSYSLYDCTDNATYYGIRTISKVKR